MQNIIDITVTEHGNDYELNLGSVGDNCITLVIFDLTDFYLRYGEGQAAIRIEYPDTGKHRTVYMEGEEFLHAWLVTFMDTAIPGTFKANIEYTTEDHTAKSGDIRCIVA